MKSALRERLRISGEGGTDALPELVEYVMTHLQADRTARDSQFEAKLTKYARMAASDYEYRKAGTQADPLDRSIFDTSNLSVQLPRNVCSFILARMHKDAFGSSPWLAVGPRGKKNPALSEQMTPYSEFKLDQACWQDKARSAMETALTLGWVPVKTTWREDWDISETLESVLFSDAHAEPVVTESGDYLTAEDDTQEVEQPAPPEIAPQPGAFPMPMANGQGMPPGQPPMAPPTAGAMPDDESAEPPGLPDESAESAPPAAPRVFAKDPSIPAPDGQNGLNFKPHLIQEKERLYAGLDFSPLYWKDVTWPINAASMTLDDPGCDMISCTLPMTIEQIRASYDPKGEDEELQAMLESWKHAAPELTEGSKPKTEQGESTLLPTDPKNPTIKITEVYFRRRVLPTGPESRCFMAVAEGYWKAVCVHYLKQMTPRAQAPLHLIAVNRVPGRAYGRGFYEMFEMASTALDRLLNQVLVRNDHHANPQNFVDAKAAAQLGDVGIKCGPGTTNTIDGKGQAIRDLFYTLELPAMEEMSWKLFELFMQLIQTESGVTNANQGDMTDLPSNSTATGVNSMLESSSVIHMFRLEEVRSGLTPALRFALELLFFKMDADEPYALLEGDDGALEQLAQAEAVLAQGPDEQAPAPAQAPNQPGVMTYAQAQELANVPLNVEILLSRSKRQEMREAALTAYPQVSAFLKEAPQDQQYLLPLMKQGLRNMEIRDADQCLPTMETIMAAIQAQQAAAAAGQKSPEERISLRENMDYGDVPPSIKAQMEKDAGFVPASDAERAAFTASQQKPAPGGGKDDKKPDGASEETPPPA